MIRIDAHQHFWHYDPVSYSWIGEQMQKLKRDFLPVDLLPELKATKFDSSIAVQARQSLEETRWLLKLASENNFIRGVVGWVDLCSNQIEDQLIEFSSDPKFVGVRHVIHDEPDDQFMARTDFCNGIQLLRKYGLTFDLLLFPKHLPLAAKLALKFPDQNFVIDHLAKPDIKGRQTEPWASDLRRIAGLPNVYCKLSGMVTEADWYSWRAEDFRFYLDTALECFGTDRLMIGSDWPVCTVAGSYKEILDPVTAYVDKMDTSSKQKIMGKNCLDFYTKKMNQNKN
jgi:L-fuconolactonase